MRPATPADLEDYAVGFTMSEGLVANTGEIQSVEVVPASDAIEVRIGIAAERFSELLRRRRNLTGRTGCGLCGTETLEQAMRPGFALAYRDKGFPKKLLAGRTARIVVTMGMPALFYKLFYGAHSVKSPERNILKFVGIGPVSRTIIGGVDASDERRKDWLAKMEALGAAGA